MKKTATWLAALCAALLALHVVGCDHDPDPVAVEYVSINTPALTLTCGGTARLTATVLPEDADDKTVLWWSSDPSVATVGEDGTVTAVMAGSASITARAGDKTAECTVTVNEATVNPVAVETIALDKNTLTLTRGETGKLTATVTPDNADDTTVTWSSSDPSVAAVGEDGTVTAVMVGSATMTAQAGDKTATCVVTVNPIPVTDITLNAPALTLTPGTAIKLTATVLPENADGVTVTWSSSHDNVATVDADGTVTTIAEGTAVITAQAGGMTAKCTVSVKQILIAVETVTLNPTTLMLTRGETGTLTATVTPGNADDTTVLWSSSDPAVATVGDDGTVTAVMVGTATVTATTQEGGKTATCAVTVNPIRVETVTLNPTTLMLMRGETGTLTATVTPENADDTTVTWSSSDPAVATVDNDGTVTTHKAGTATITARADGKEATCAVTVNPIRVENVTLNPTTLTLMREKTGKLTATVMPENADDTTVTWSSSDPAVATVGNDGTVTAVTVGTATVTATTREGGKTATCTVTVSPIPVAAVTLNPTTLTLAPGETGKLTATVTPNNADDKTVTWSSSAPAVATVGDDGTVRAVSKGTTNITAKAGGKEVSCAVTVRVAVANIVLDKQTLTLAPGKTGTLTATVTPEDADDTTVAWSSSNEAIVTVGEDGTVRAVKRGTASITARAGGKTAVCEVTVHTEHVYSNDACTACGFPRPFLLGGTIDNNGVLTKYFMNDTAVDIPDGVTSIGDGAFYGRTSLTSVTIPDSVTSIEDYAFYGCTSLESVTIGDGVTSIGVNAFDRCSSLTSVIIPDSVTSIGKSAFYMCDSLTDVTIGNGVTEIGEYAFRECSSLTSVIIPDSMTSIGKRAFAWSGLTSVTIPDSVTSIGDSAFSGCHLTSVTIPDSVTSIGDGAFAGCHLTSVTIPDSVTSIRSGVFSGCLLTSVRIPDNVTSIGDEAFYNCTELTDVTIGNGVTEIGGGAFKECSGLTSVTIPGNVTSIGGEAFYHCTGLTDVTIDDGVTSIGDKAFYECISLRSVTTSGNVTSIGKFAFTWCDRLTDVTIGGSVTSINDSAFYKCSVRSVAIGGSVTSIGADAFYGCTSLESVTIGGSVTSIGNYAFCDCTSLKSAPIPDGVTSIDHTAFRGCTSLTSVTIPDSVTYIGTCAFERCTELTTVTIPASVTKVGLNLFKGCDKLTDVHYTGTKEEWERIEGISDSGLADKNIVFAK